MNRLGRLFILTIMTILWIIIILLYLNFHKTEIQEWIYRPLPPHSLSDQSGNSINIKTQFPNKDYLLFFYVDSSPTSQEQLKEVSLIIKEIPGNFILLFIHLGRKSTVYPTTLGEGIHILIDAETDLAQQMGISVVPSFILLKNGEIEVNQSQGLVKAEQLRNYLALFSSGV